MKFGNTGPLYEGEGLGGGGANPPPNPNPNPPPVAEHPVAPWNGAQGVWNIGEGDKAAPWWNTLGDEAARKHVEAKQYASPAELALANYNLTRLQTGDPQVLALPAKDAPPEAWNDVYAKLGRPETPQGYDEVLKFGDDVKVDPATLDFGKKAFHEAGLSPTQAKKVAEAWNGFAVEQQAANLAQMQAENKQEITALESRWGPELEKNKAAGHRVVQALGLPADFVERIEGQIGSAPVVELLAMIGRKSDEGTFLAGGGQTDPNNPATMTKEQAGARITTLQADAEFQKKYTDKNHPGHAEALQLMERLYARA